MADQVARQDANQFPALTAHTGTAGTAEVIRLVADADGQLKTTASVSAPGTQRVRAAATADPAEWVVTRLTDGTAYYNAGGGAGGSVVVTVGTISSMVGQFAEDAGHSSGAVGNLILGVRNDAGTSLSGADLDYTPATFDANGALRVSGTVATGAGTQAVRIIDGTVTSVSNVANGTLAAVTSVGSVVGVGTLTNVGSITNVGLLYGGTIDTTGTVTGVGVVTNLTSGSVRMTVGTLTVMPNIPGGTLALVTSVTELANLAKGTVSRVEGGSIAVTAGTAVVTGGSIVVTTGTVNVGTVRNDARTTQNILTYGTQFAATAAAYGTLIGSAAVGAGTSTWVQGVSVINPYGTILAMVGFGTVLNGTSVLFKGVLGTQTVGGIEKSFAKAVNAGMTNQDLVLHLGAAGTVDVSVTYFISA